MVLPFLPIHLDEAYEYVIGYVAKLTLVRGVNYSQSTRPFGSELWAANIAEKFYNDTQRINIRDYGNEAELVYIPFYDAIWELCRIGVLRPGQVAPRGMGASMGGAFQGDGYCLTDYGLLWIKTASSKPHVPTDPSRFTEVLLPFEPRFGEGFMQRASEAARCYRTCNYLACCVMAGGATESILLATAIAKAGDESKVSNDYRAKQGRATILDRITGNAKKSIADQFRMACGNLSFWRDEAGHGQITTINEAEAYMALGQLLRLAQFTADNWAELTAPSNTAR